MLNYFDKKNEIKSLKEELTHAFQGINPEKLRVRIGELEAEQNAEGFWNDVERAQKVSKELSQLTSKISKFEKLLAELDDAELENSEEEDEALVKRVARLSEEVEKLTLSTLLSGKYDSLNAILTLHAGAGGTEAQDWCEMLYRMYTRYVERSGWGCTELDCLPGDEAGLKSSASRATTPTATSRRKRACTGLFAYLPSTARRGDTHRLLPSKSCPKSWILRKSKSVPRTSRWTPTAAAARADSMSTRRNPRCA